MPKLLIKLFLTSLFLVLIFKAFPRVVFSQENPVVVEKTAFEKQYDEYQAKIKVYATLHQDYVVKRSQYIKFKTLTSQEDAFDSTLAMLQARNDVLSAYFQTLKEKLKDGDDIPGDVEAVMTLELDDESAWLVAHQNTTSTAGTLDDLVKDSQKASNQFNQKEVAIAYKSLSTFALGRVLGYTKRTEDLFSLLKKKIDVIRSETRSDYSFSSAKFQILDRWMFDAETRIERAKQKNLSVQNLFTDKDLKQKGENAISQYNLSLSNLGQSQLFLKEANTFMSEVIREIKLSEN